MGINVKGYTFKDRSNGNYDSEFKVLPQSTLFEKTANSLSYRILDRVHYCNIRGLYLLKKELKSFDPDLIVIHFGTTLLKVHSAINSLHQPIVTIFHGFDASQYLKNKDYVRKLKEIFEKPKYYASCVAQDMINRFSAHQINTRNFHYHHLGVDTEYFKHLGSQRDENFLQVSNFVEKKGHLYTLRAFKLFLDRNKKNRSKLILAGDGPMRQNIIDEILKLDLGDSVVLFGLADREQVRNLMRKNLYFVHHSVTSCAGDKEGIPTVIMEAMAMDMAVISTTHSGIPELINSDSLGVLVNEGDVNEMSLAFETILSRPYRTRSRVVNDFNSEKNTKKFIEFLLEIYKNNKSLV
jgi:glycosyltransferase involved in cell wall biosynthesis